jgi:hypothetical protein
LDELIWDENGGGGSGQLLLATVGTSIDGQGSTLRIDGDSATGSQRYRKISGQSLAAGDRVLVAQVGGSYVIIGKIVL